MAENDDFKMKLSKEDLQKLQEQAGGGGNSSSNRFSNLSINYISSIFGVVILILLVISIILSYLGVGTIIDPLEAESLDLQSQANQEWPVLKKIEEQWNTGNVQQAVLTLEKAADDIEGSGNQTLLKKVHLANLKGLIILEEYGNALRKSQELQVKYTKDRAYLADVYYYKAHAYYYMKRYLSAVGSFDRAINNGTKYMQKAEEYSSEIRELL